HRSCLWPQVREALSWFQGRYEPMRERIEALVAKKPSPEELIAAIEGGDALPAAVRNRVRRDERLDAALSGLRRIATEQRQVEGEYWPDEIGCYRYTLKNACPAQRKGDAQVAAAHAPANAEEAARDAAVDSKRDEMIADLDRMLRKIEEGPRKADMYFQLAE